MLIAHATDRTGDDAAAFLHASALAARSGARLLTLHGNAPSADADHLPDAAPYAAAWGRPIAHERRCHECCDEVADTVIDALRAAAPDLIVLGTHGRHGLAALLHGSVSESIARNVAAPALVVPNHSRGFVDAATGALGLRRIVIPAGTLAEARHGLLAARWFLALTGTRDAALALVHVGAEVPGLGELGVEVARVDGPIEAAVLAAAHARDACMVVMPTAGHDSVGDVVRGSHTERVIREARCPVLSVPLAGLLSAGALPG